MTLDVTFVFEVDTILVANVVPIGVANVVRVAHVVDITALHEHHFVLHLFARDGMTAFGASFVTIHTFHLDGLAIQVIIATFQAEFVFRRRCVLDFALTETYVCRESFDYLALLVLQLANEYVAIRCFSAPLLDACAHLHRYLCVVGIVLAERVHLH